MLFILTHLQGLGCKKALLFYRLCKVAKCNKIRGNTKQESNYDRETDKVQGRTALL